MRTISNIEVGEADTTPSAPSHVPGVKQGNSPRAARRMAGFEDEGDRGTGSAERSTGIDADARDPIDPRMPNLSPA